MTAGSEGDAVAVASLDDLKIKIESTSDRIRNLKASSDGAGADEIPSLVKELVDLKSSYAASNGGIGVDGKPYEEPLSKSEKKKRAKAEKAALAAKEAEKKKAEGVGGGGGDGGQEDKAAASAAGDESKGSQKKAAKKAEKAAKRAAMKAPAKEGGGGDGGGGRAPSPTKGGKSGGAVKGGGGGGREEEGGGGGRAAQGKASASNKKGTPSPPVVSSQSRLGSMQLSFNPNVPLSERPVVALTVSCLLNCSPDLTIVSDHTRHGGPALGLPDGGGEVTGDLAIARYLARTLDGGGAGPAVDGTSLLGGDSASGASAVDQWVDYALAVSRFSPARRARAVGVTLNAALASHTYVAGGIMTLADLAVYASLGFPCGLDESAEVLALLGAGAAKRWMDSMASHPSVREAAQLAMGVSNDAEACFEAGTEMDALVEGMNSLRGAVPGSVVTRFPPEPSGYLHVGHAKAVLLNDYYARRYRGRLIVRFDDTNPSKEKEEYQASILEDLGKLGVKPDVVTFTSDYFQCIRGYAERLINEGLAFMDDTPQEKMQKERMDRLESVHRGQSVSDAMEKFKLMCSGKPEGSVWCLRARIDMSSVNGTMRDPVLYRQNVTSPHHRSGTKYSAYPTYDLACPIVDSVEGVTHALRTTEYEDRNEQYAWIQARLGLRRVRIHSFARMSFVHTVLSKRKLTWFVEKGHVTGWDDPRMPTVRGVVRRGIDIPALRAFICSQGASRRIVNMEWNKFWSENKKRIDEYSLRYMAIDETKHVKMTVTNGPDRADYEYLSADFHPKDPSLGKRLVRICKEVLLEAVDAESLVVGEDIVLMRWGVVNVTKAADGEIEGTFVPGGDFKKAKKKLSWIASVPENVPCVLTEFDNLLTKEKLEEDDKFEDYVNPDTEAETRCVGDAGLRNLAEHDIIQLERRGYYRVDRPYINESKPLVLYMIPDGKKKPMSGLEGRLKHA